MRADLTSLSVPKSRTCSGFTMIELMVVILIISMTAALVVPRLPAPESTRLKSSARNLATGIRFLNDRAIISKGIYRLRVNVSDNAVTWVKLSTEGEELAPDDAFQNRKLLADGIAIEDVTTSKNGKITEGEAIVPFGPGGSPDLLTIHLKGGEERYTIIAYPFGGKVRVLEGYQEEQPA